MNLHNRVAKLEAAFARKSSDPTAPTFDIDAMISLNRDYVCYLWKLISCRGMDSGTIQPLKGTTQVGKGGQSRIPFHNPMGQRPQRSHGLLSKLQV